MRGSLTPESDAFSVLVWWKVCSKSDSPTYCSLSLPIGQENAHEFPVLATIARDYLAVQGSSVPCERAFSSSKLTDSDHRCNLTSENFGAIQMVKGSLKKIRQREQLRVEKEKEAQFLVWKEQEREAKAARMSEAGVVP